MSKNLNDIPEPFNKYVNKSTNEHNTTNDINICSKKGKNDFNDKIFLILIIFLFLDNF